MKIRKGYPLRFVGYAFVGCLLVLAAKLGLGNRPLDFNNSQAAVSTMRRAAVFSPDGVQIPSQIYAVSPKVLAVEIAPPAVTLGQQRPYVAEPQDIIRQRNGRRWVRRGDEVLGLLVGKNRDILYSSDVVAPSSFLLSQADTPARYEIRSRDDGNYAIAQSPIRLFRKTKPIAFARKANGKREWPALTTLYLTLPSPMQPGKNYQLSFPGLGLEDTVFAYQPMAAHSEAVHVSHLGFRPDDAVKVGYLSTWMGNGGGFDYLDGLRFSVIDTQTDRAVFDGVAVRRRGQSQTEDNRQRDYTLSEVHQLDFGAVTQPGTYRLCVEGVGCSFDFEIGDGVWQAPFKTAARGFYHQRSGIEIGPPFSEYERPRAFHPDDGVVIYQSMAAVLNTKMGIGERDAFEALLAGKTDEVVPNAWGGYFDAGDWDRRTSHLTVPRRLLELHGLFPEYFDAIALNLPESNNDLPDILDEALWSIDFFRRLQMADGGIRGGIESAAHPNRGEASWQESLTVMAYAPDVWTSYMYAGVAAKAAYALQPYDAALAEGYADSALRAMAYAEANYVASDYTEGPRLHRVADERNLAALELYRLTGERAWHDLFLSTTVFQSADADARANTRHDQTEAAFLYAHLNDSLSSWRNDLSVDLPVQGSVQANAEAAFLRVGEQQVTLTETTAFGWTKHRIYAALGWRNGLGAPAAVNLLRAYTLSENEKYLQAALSAVQFSAGANPDNMVFTTGLGDRSPQHPLVADQRITGQAAPPGITVFGPADYTFYKDYWIIDALSEGTFPAPESWPSVENYFDIYSYPMGAEFTVDYMVDTAYAWGYLAARK